MVGGDNNKGSLGNGVAITRSYNGGSDATTQCEVLNDLKIMTTEVLLVEQRALFCVEVSRVLAVEVDSDVRSPDLLRRRIREGEADYGPFTDRFQVLNGTGYLEPLSIRVVGTTTDHADIPLAVESEVEA